MELKEETRFQITEYRPYINIYCVEHLIFLYGLDKGSSEAFLIRDDYKESKELRKVPQSGGEGGQSPYCNSTAKNNLPVKCRCARDFRYQLNFLLLFINS